jgi:hypothetical protein
VTSYFGAVGIRVTIRPMERGAFFKEYGDKRLKQIIQSTSAAFGNAATRLDAFVAAGSLFTYDRPRRRIAASARCSCTGPNSSSTTR